LCLKIFNSLGQDWYLVFGVRDGLPESLFDLLLIAVNICSQGIEACRIFSSSLGGAGFVVGVLYRGYGRNFEI